MEIEGRAVAFSSDPVGLAHDCNKADMVIALYPAPKNAAMNCTATLIDRRATWENGAYTVWLGPNGTWRIKSVDGERGNRAWHG